MDPGQAKLSAQLSGIVSRVIRQCLLALAEPASSSSSGSCGQCSGSRGLQAAGYLCREMQGDLKYILAFNSPRVSHVCSAWRSVFAFAVVKSEVWIQLGSHDSQLLPSTAVG
jgi:hypothetical protein